MFARNHEDSRLFPTRLCASIWISTQVSARFGSLCRPFSAVVVSATEPARKKTKFEGRSERNPTLSTLPRKISSADEFQAAGFCEPDS